MSPLVVMALEVESQGLLESAGASVLFTGVGKVNAAHALTRRLAEICCAGLPLPHVINFGTAGSRTLKTGSIVACRFFTQRDMDVSPLGFPQGVTPFDRLPDPIEFPTTFADLPNCTCGSGDSFESRGIATPCEVLDMEAYALAKVCRLESAPFSCIKYITDGADGSAADDWNANLPGAAKSFLEFYRSLISYAA